MSLGDTMGDKIPTTTKPKKPTAPPVVADDDEFIDDGVKAPTTGGLIAVQSPVRPNGQAYTPRTLFGHQDIAWLRKVRDLRQPALFYGPPGTGKLLPLDTPIPTPTGWATMGDLAVGDRVLGRDGKPTKVTFVSAVEPSPVLYDLTFSDGSVVTACADHQWTVSSRKAWLAARDATRRLRSHDEQRAALAVRRSDIAAVALDPATPAKVTASELKGLLDHIPGMPWTHAGTLNNFLLRANVPHTFGPRAVDQHHRRLSATRTSVRDNRRLFDAKQAIAALAESSRAPFEWSDAAVAAPEEVMTTQQIVDAGVTDAAGRRRFSVRLTEPLDLPEVALLVDPYVLGVWLGDGHSDYFDAGDITSADPQIVNEVIRAGYDLLSIKVDQRGNQAYRFAFEHLGRDLSAAGMGSKRIPQQYQRASVQQRLALLQGLMDTDGTISRNGTCEIALSDADLATDVEELIHGLGIKVTRRVAAAGYRTADGILRGGKDQHRMVFTTTLAVFRLPRKAINIPSSTRGTQSHVYIVGAVPAPTRPGGCITVDNADHMYLCGTAMLPTHNTAISEAAFFGDAKVDVATDTRTTYVHVGFETIVCGLGTTEDDFFGTWVQDPITGAYVWEPGPLQKAVEQGIPLYVDEIFLCQSRVLAATIYPLMDGRDVLRVPSNPRLAPITVPDGFVVIAAGNPDVPGAEYSEALRSRFHHQVYIGTDWELAKALKVPQKIVTAAKKLDVHREQGTISASPQLRELLAFKVDKDEFGEEYAIANLLGKTPVEDRPTTVQELAAFGTVTPLTMGARHAG